MSAAIETIVASAAGDPRRFSFASRSATLSLAALAVPQLLTLFTTPVVYLYLNRVKTLPRRKRRIPQSRMPRRPRSS